MFAMPCHTFWIHSGSTLSTSWSPVGFDCLLIGKLSQMGIGDIFRVGIFGYRAAVSVPMCV